MGKKLIGLVCAQFFVSQAMAVTFYCGPICGDVNGSCFVDGFDMVWFMAFVGFSTETADPELDGSCLDSLFCDDGYLDSNDVTGWNWRIDTWEQLNVCSDPVYLDWLHYWFPETETVPSSGDTNHGNNLLVSGLSSNGGMVSRNEGLYLYNQQVENISNPFSPIAPYCNSRLVCDSKARVYQLNVGKGLARLNDGKVVVPRSILSVSSDPRYEVSATVTIGTHVKDGERGGREIRDVAIDSQGYVYVAPVVVHTSSPSATYLAAAKLQLSDNDSNCYSIVELYDDPPSVGDNRDPMRKGLREIEVDADGNVYIASAYLENASDFLWAYPAGGGSPTKVALDNISGVTGGIPDPIALCASRKSRLLYLASGLSDPDDNVSHVYVLSTDNLSLSVVRTVQINGMGHVTGITEDPATGNVWVVGFTMPTRPETITADQSVFYYPYMAKIPDNSSGPVTATALSNSTLAMPLSVTFLPPNVIRGTVDLQDYIGSPGEVPVTVELRKDGVITPYAPTLSDTGDFEISGISSGTYDVRVKASHWLATVQTGIEVSGSTTIATPFVMINGDADGDNECGDSDVDLVSTQWGYTISHPRFYADADLDGDGTIGEYDYAILGNTYGSLGEEFPH